MKKIYQQFLLNKSFLVNKNKQTTYTLEGIYTPFVLYWYASFLPVELIFLWSAV